MTNQSNKYEDRPDHVPPRSATPDHPSAAAQAASALQEIFDDDTPRGEAIAWAVEELYQDQSFEWVAVQLSAGGWPDDDVSAIVEEARRRTRTHRGAVTREQITLDADRLYRRATGRWVIGMPMIGAAWRLLHSLAALVSLRRRKPRATGAENLDRRHPRPG